jgi:hypothetical protein
MKTKKELSDAIKSTVRELERLTNEAKSKGLIVEIQSGSLSLGGVKEWYEAHVYEKVVY